MSELDAVAQRLERARLVRGLSLGELARRADVASSTLSSIRTGKRQGAQLTLAQARRLCLVLQISVDWLCGRWTEDLEVPSPPDADGWSLTAAGESTRRMPPCQTLLATVRAMETPGSRADHVRR